MHLLVSLQCLLVADCLNRASSDEARRRAKMRAEQAALRIAGTPGAASPSSTD